MLKMMTTVYTDRPLTTLYSITIVDIIYYNSQISHHFSKLLLLFLKVKRKMFDMMKKSDTIQKVFFILLGGQRCSCPAKREDNYCSHE